MSVPCLYTTVVNTGPERSFSFLPPHGKRLASDEQFSVPGHLADQLAQHPRKFHALERSLEDGALAIMRTPAVHLFDTSDGDNETKVLNLDNDTLGAIEPCWGSFISE